MTCTQINNGIVCQPSRGRLVRLRTKCRGICETPTSRVVQSEGSPWYAPVVHCVDCGDSWDWEEGRYERPFRRGRRKEAIKRHEALWERACYCDVQYDENRYAKPCSLHPDAV